MVVQHASLLRQRRVAVASHPTRCPQLYFHRRTLADAVRPNFRRNSFTIPDRARHRQIIPTMVVPRPTSGGIRLFSDELLLFLGFAAGIHPKQLIESKTLFQYQRP